MFWKKKKDDAEKEWYVEKIDCTAPWDIRRKEILKKMTLDELKEVTEIIEELRKRGTNGVCERCLKMNAAMRMYNCFEWGPDLFKPFRLDYDESTRSILVPEEMLMHFIQLANPDQPKRNIKLIKSTYE